MWDGIAVPALDQGGTTMIGSALDTFATEHGGYFSITPIAARQLKASLNGGNGWMRFEEGVGTVLTIPEEYAPPQPGRNSPWGEIESTSEVSNNLHLIRARNHCGGLWIGWDRVMNLPRDYRPWTGLWSWANRYEAPLLLSFFLVDGPVFTAVMEAHRSTISQNAIGQRYHQLDNYRELCARAAELGWNQQLLRLTSAMKTIRGEADTLKLPKRS